MTDLDRSPLVRSNLHTKRMTVEELFRDDKNRRNRYALRNTRITRADRIDRLALGQYHLCLTQPGDDLLDRVLPAFRPKNSFAAWSKRRQVPTHRPDSFPGGKVMFGRRGVRCQPLRSERPEGSSCRGEPLD